ncbi:TPA: hypothetical protein HA251_08190 [Candidatus Woesearchaeota archaeon]|nr:hypothetical protein [Candidatus Woesearchaeota archaeon]
MAASLESIMNSITESVGGRLVTPDGTIDLVVIVCVGMCAFALLISVLIDFL